MHMLRIFFLIKTIRTKLYLAPPLYKEKKLMSYKYTVNL